MGASDGVTVDDGADDGEAATEGAGDDGLADGTTLASQAVATSSITSANGSHDLVDRPLVLVPGRIAPPHTYLMKSVLRRAPMAQRYAARRHRSRSGILRA